MASSAGRDEEEAAAEASSARGGKEAIDDGEQAAAAATTLTSTSSSAPRPPPAPAAPAPPLDEIDRILRVQHNAYAVLKLDRRAKPTPDDIKKAHRALSRLVHPDKNPGNAKAADASAALNAAVDILTDPVKRRVFDLYVQDTGSELETATDNNKSFADWEAERMRPPRWLLRVLGCPGGGVLVAVAALLLLIPAVALLIVVTVLCLPLRLIFWHCCGIGEPVFPPRRKGRKRGEGEGERGGGGDVELGERK